MHADPGAILRLINWLSPSFPVGGFSYSHGLEQAVDQGLVTDRSTLREWLVTLLFHGSAWNDGVLLAEAWRIGRQQGDCRSVGRLGEALAGGAERHLETMAQGRAFLTAVAAWQDPVPGALPPDTPLPVAVGACAGQSNVPLAMAIGAFLNGFVSNLVQIAQRLMPLGQQGGVCVLAGMEPALLCVARQLQDSTLRDLGGFAQRAEMAALAHETKNMRMFRT